MRNAVQADAPGPLDAKTGARVGWSVVDPDPEFVDAALSVAGDLVYAVAGGLRVIPANCGPACAPLVVLPLVLNDFSPVISDGTVYVTSGNQLMALRGLSRVICARRSADVTPGIVGPTSSARGAVGTSGAW